MGPAGTETSSYGAGVWVMGQVPSGVQEVARPWGAAPSGGTAAGLGEAGARRHSPTQAVPSSLGSKPRLQRLLLRQRYPP